MQLVAKLPGSFDRWWFDGYRVSPQSLTLCRLIFASYVLLAGAHDFTWVSDIPHALFRPPPGPMSVFSDFPAAWFLHALRFGVLLSASCLLCNVYPVAAYLALGTCLFFAYGAAYSTGKVTHNILYVVAPFFMAALERTAFNPTRRSATYWPLSLLAFLLAFMMATAGVPKLLFGWLDTTSSAVQAYYVEANVLRDPLLPSSLARLTPWKLLDWATVLFEFAFLFCVWWPRTLRILCAIGAVFHALVLTTLDISFGTNLVAYAMLFDWQPIAAKPFVSRLLAFWDKRCASVRLWHCILLAAAYVVFLPNALLNEISYAVGFSDRAAVFATPADIALLLAGGLAGAAYVVCALLRAFRVPRQSVTERSCATSGPMKS